MSSSIHRFEHPIEPETLALLSLGEPVATAEEDAHLRACAECRAELAELERAVGMGRAADRPGALPAPSPAVWERISAQIAGDTGAARTRPHVATRRSGAAAGRRRVPLLLASAAAVVALVAGGAVAWQALRPVETAPRVIARATLDAFPAWPGAVGDATVERLADGDRVLHLAIDAHNGTGDAREAWLITRDASALVSLGAVEGDTASFVIPDDIDLSTYALVDVSDEPDDGDPAHSGDSIVRGELHGT